LKTTELAKAYFEKAESDMRDAERAFRDGSYSTCAFFCQQTAEKALKSILAMKGIETRTHHVSKVALENIKRFKLGKLPLSRLRRVAEISETLEPHVARARYPWREGTKLLRPEQYYTEVVTERFMKDARKALELA
jgi:HEPN domain-containing protein